MAWFWSKRKRFEAPTLIGRPYQASLLFGNRICRGSAFSRAKFGKYDIPHYSIKVLKWILLWGFLVAMFGWLLWESLPGIRIFE